MEAKNCICLHVQLGMHLDIGPSRNFFTAPEVKKYIVYAKKYVCVPVNTFDLSWLRHGLQTYSKEL